ncbi:GDSL family lipase [Novosphingobium flavum]|uniref:GDSL family lipase n=2 Tax=Novosphingobium flavum TaxID=1778672 RepID=A0A7X1KN33_9SPHN|nr:GDSL family lipase [Novosphingobium flavum]
MSDAPCPVPSAKADDGWQKAYRGWVAGNDWPWLCRYKAANLSVNARPDVVFMGDSISELWLVRDPAFFRAGRLDRGISGQTTPQMLVRFMADVVALKPKAVHIMAGTNDIAGNTGPTSVEAWRNNIRAMADLARANGIAVVLGSIPPAASFAWRPGMQPAARIAELNGWLKGFAAERRLVYADYYAALAAPDGSMKPGLSSDGVHPNAAGYAVMDPVAEAALAEALKVPTAGPPSKPRR